MGAHLIKDPQDKGMIIALDRMSELGVDATIGTSNPYLNAVPAQPGTPNRNYPGFAFTHTGLRELDIGTIMESSKRLAPLFWARHMSRCGRRRWDCEDRS
jgi:hypothetical protein